MRWIIAGLLTVGLLLSPAARADQTNTVNFQKTWGIWEGWGASLCWWAKAFGNRDDVADVIFTTNYTTLNGVSLPGLGLNIARYNAGACSANSVNGQFMQVSPNIHPSRQMEGYWLNGNSTDPNSASWNLNADANQRAMLLKAKARGANLFELFSNSPMWWMCTNRNPSGAAWGYNDNLDPAYRQHHAIYLATIAKLAKDNFGIEFDSVEPFNEPSAGWWTANGTQEGCHFGATTQIEVIDHLRAELDARGLTNTQVAASDESTFGDAWTTWTRFGADTQDKVGRVNVHGYGGANVYHRDELYRVIEGKRLWNSEYGESDATGASMAYNLNLDFHYLHPTAWCYWQPLDGSNWGLIHSTVANGTIGAPNRKYYVLAQYTRHIRPGMVILESETYNTVSAYDPVARKLVLVTYNDGAAQIITCDLGNFYQANGPVRRWMTTIGAGANYLPLAQTAMNNKRFQFPAAANSIQTVEIQNVELVGPPVITQHPVGQLVDQGSSASLSVTAIGRAPLSYSWFRDNELLEGATNPTLTLTNFQDVNAGVYTAVVSNELAVATSAGALLKINHPPVANASATAPTVVSANGVNAIVTLDGSLSRDVDGDPLHYLWFASGNPRAIGNGVTRLEVLPVGAHDIKLVVSDGRISNTNSVAVRVVSTRTPK